MSLREEFKQLMKTKPIPPYATLPSSGIDVEWSELMDGWKIDMGMDINEFFRRNPDIFQAVQERLPDLDLKNISTRDILKRGVAEEILNQLIIETDIPGEADRIFKGQRLRNVATGTLTAKARNKIYERAFERGQLPDRTSLNPEGGVRQRSIETIPKKTEGSKRGSYIKNPMSFDERVAFGAQDEANLKDSLDSGLQQMKPGGAQVDYNGELYTVIPNKKSKAGYTFKRVTDLNEVARIRNIKKAEKFISLEDRIDGMRQIFKSEYPGSVIPDDEIVKLATEIQEFNETDVKLKGGYAARVGKDIDDRFPISGEGGYFSTHQLEPEDRVFNQHTKRHLFPKHPIDEAGTHYGNFKQIGMTKLEQIKYDLSSPLYKGKRITANIDGKMLRRALFGTVSGVAASFASPLKTLAAIPDVIPITYAFDALSLGTTQLDKWATKQLPDDHVYESGATKQQALDFLNKQTAADVVGLEPTGVGNIPAVIHQQTDPRETEEQKRERSEQAIQNVRTMQQHGMTPWF